MAEAGSSCGIAASLNTSASRFSTSAPCDRITSARCCGRQFPPGSHLKSSVGLMLGDGFGSWRYVESVRVACGRGASRRRFISQIAVNAVDSPGDLPPVSREETVEQAGASLFSLLEKALRVQGPTTVKQKKSQRQMRLRVDIPVLDESPQALFALTLDLIESFLGDKKVPGTVAVYCPSSLLNAIPEGFVNVSKVLETRFFSLESEETVPRDAAVALIVAPTFMQAASLGSVASSAGVRPIVLLNPEFSPEEEADQLWGSFLASFEVAYSFIPLSIQGFFSTTEGAILKYVKSGAPAGRPWLIFVKEGESYKCVSSLKRRPDSADLENALYNSMAANSPVNKSIQFLRGLGRP